MTDAQGPLPTDEPDIIPDPEAYDRPGDVPTNTISQAPVDFGKTDEDPRDDG